MRRVWFLMLFVALQLNAADDKANKVNQKVDASKTDQNEKKAEKKKIHFEVIYYKWKNSSVPAIFSTKRFSLSENATIKALKMKIGMEFIGKDFKSKDINFYFLKEHKSVSSDLTQLDKENLDDISEHAPVKSILHKLEHDKNNTYTLIIVPRPLPADVN